MDDVPPPMFFHRPVNTMVAEKNAVVRLWLTVSSRTLAFSVAFIWSATRANSAAEVSDSEEEALHLALRAAYREK